jgi:streptogramin lyase
MVGRIATSGAITLYDGRASSFPTDLLAGPDGSVWFLDQGHQQALGRILPDGQLAFYPFHTLMDVTSTITVGPDGNIWVALYKPDSPGNRIGSHDALRPPIS